MRWRLSNASGQLSFAEAIMYRFTSLSKAEFALQQLQFEYFCRLSVPFCVASTTRVHALKHGDGFWYTAGTHKQLCFNLTYYISTEILKHEYRVTYCLVHI
jgi:hypothetical protein